MVRLLVFLRLLILICLWQRREEAGPHVLGVSGSVHRAHTEWADACKMYNNAWDLELVKVVRKC